ncbi:hypothetical protein BJ138DRAFT_1013472, partial [Hygrophoropsis aurantiaca]
MNTFTWLLTFLLRSNSDVTSLLSGTAIKAVVAYISDYISKPSLKTYAIFETIVGVFSKNATMLNGSLERKEKARKIMTQIVNALTSKMEIGAPMASMYLLDNPDHYTSHSFATFFWKSYVSETRNEATEVGGDVCSERLLLQNHKGKVIGTSPVFDYVYRPAEFARLSLYDWVRYSDRQKKPVRGNKVVGVAGLGLNGEIPEAGTDFFEFEDGHPLKETHHTKCVGREYALVPNFVGGAVPRRDRGDYDYYCSAMLTFFKAWRSSIDLKDYDESWSEAFSRHEFKDCEIEIMKNFNVRYECLDARDDYSAKRREGEDSGPNPTWDRYSETEDKADANEEWLDGDHTSPAVGQDCVLDPYAVGSKTSKWNFDKAVVEQILQSSGWLDRCDERVANNYRECITVDPSLNSKDWKNRVKLTRDELLESRLKDMSIRPSRLSTSTSLPERYTSANEVKLVDKAYLSRSFTPKKEEERLHIDKVAIEFSLNPEQDRAFRIVANHATMESPDQLKMHLGGMAGTGKSQVIRALTKFFKDRNESHRMISLAPTGSAAALLGGYT